MKRIIIVEGKSDTRRLKEIYPHVVTFETSGLGIDEQKINQLQKLEKSGVELICFTDPDYPGERIRSILSDNLLSLKHAYVPRTVSIAKNGKIGVESASDAGIINALDNIMEPVNNLQKFTLEDLMLMNIVGNKQRREQFCDLLGIANGNNKKVLRQLNGFNITYDDVRSILKELDGK